MLNPSLIRNIAQGDVVAFRTLYDQFAPRMLYYVFKTTQNRQASEDIVHEAFVFLWENRCRMEDVIDLKAYLFAVTRNLVRNHTRVESLRKRILDGLEFPEKISEQHVLITAEICGQIRRSIAQLPPQTRTVIELSMLGLSVAEVAAQMEISPNTVKTLKKNGYQALREKLVHLKALLAFLFIS